jgi:hypothetical protein
MLLELCGRPAGTTVQTVADAMYGNSLSMAKQWAAGSLGAASLYWTGKTDDVIRVVQVPCAIAPDDSACYFDRWVPWLEANAAALQLPLRNFTYKLYIARAGACGIGFATGDLAFVHSDWAADLNVYKHEVGHLLGLRHASTPGAGVRAEYGDSSNPLGSNCGTCLYHAPHMLQLGWGVPVATVAAEHLPVATGVSFALPAVGKAKGSALVVVPDWPLPVAGGSITGAWYYVVVSYRVQWGQDAGIKAPFQSSASVHFVARAWEQNPLLMGTAAVGAPFVDRNTGLVVGLAAAGGSEALQVVLCRYDASPAQCNM